MLESKKVAVLFSGGLDSTYLIWKNLTEGNEVYPIYIEIKNNDGKVRLEKNRVGLLYDKFNEEFGDKIHSVRYALEILVRDTSVSELHLNQLPIWIIGLQWLHGLDVSEFQFGYVMNDDAISYIDDIKTIHKSFSGLHDRVIELTFPLIKEKKCMMANKLPKRYFDLVVSCESPEIVDDKCEILKYEPCCNCPACNRLISEYYDLISDKTIYEGKLKDKRLFGVEQYAVDGVIDFKQIFGISSEPFIHDTLNLYMDKKEIKQLEFDFPE